MKKAAIAIAVLGLFAILMWVNLQDWSTPEVTEEATTVETPTANQQPAQRALTPAERRAEAAREEEREVARLIQQPPPAPPVKPTTEILPGSWKMKKSGKNVSLTFNADGTHSSSAFGNMPWTVEGDKLKLCCGAGNSGHVLTILDVEEDAVVLRQGGSQGDVYVIFRSNSSRIGGAGSFEHLYTRREKAMLHYMEGQWQWDQMGMPHTFDDGRAISAGDVEYRIHFTRSNRMVLFRHPLDTGYIYDIISIEKNQLKFRNVDSGIVHTGTKMR